MNVVDDLLSVIYQRMKSTTAITDIVATIPNVVPSTPAIYNTPNMPEVTNAQYPHINFFLNGLYPYGVEVRRTSVLINCREQNAAGLIDKCRLLAFEVAEAFNATKLPGSNNQYYFKASIQQVITEDQTTFNNPVQLGIDIIGGE
jgi:hypothetical protein